METKEFKYSAAQMTADVVFLVVITLVIYLSLIPGNSDNNNWLIFGLALSIPIGRFVYLTVMYFIPCWNDKTALELDEDKLQLFITGKLLFQIPRDVAYWKDIKDIEYFSPYRGSPVISFKMNDGSSFGFRTTYIAGNDKEIYNTIMEYYNNR